MRLHHVDITKDTYSKPLITFDMGYCEGGEVVNVRNLPESEQLKHDALDCFVTIEAEIASKGMERTALGEELAELKLRLFGSLMAGF